MANDRVYNSTDAAGIKPKFVPTTSLMARDDSGGPDFDNHTADFADTYIVGAKAHLSASGGAEDAIKGDEISDAPRTKDALKAKGN